METKDFIDLECLSDKELVELYEMLSGMMDELDKKGGENNEE